MKTYILHHDDSDGYCAAAAAKYFIQKCPGYQIKLGDVEYHAVDYGVPLPKMDDDSNVYILDFSITLEQLEELTNRMLFVRILDHHVSAFIKIGHHKNTFFDMSRSGAMIAFEYFRDDCGLYSEQTPEFVKYVQDQDLGKFDLEDSVDVKNYIYSLPLDINTYLNHFNVSKYVMVKEGAIITRYAETLMKNALKNAVVINVDGFRMLAINSAVLFSDIGSYLRDKVKEYDCHFAGSFYRMNNEMIKFSLRSTSNFDVSILAGRFGGGGHKQAAGFEVNVKIFDGYNLSYDS